MKLHNICVFGLGGVGGYFGGRIAYQIEQAPQSPHKVFFIARGEHLAQIQKQGLILNTSERQGLICKPAIATDTLTDLPTPDLYLLCVKSYDLDTAVNAIRQNMRPETVIIPLLNGVDIYERIRQNLPTGVVLPACVYVGTHIAEPGVVTQKGGDGVIICGKDPQSAAFNPQEVIDVFTRLNINFQWKDEPYPDIWGKYLFIAAFGLVTACSGKTLGAVMADPASQAQVRQIMAEVVALAAKKGVALPENSIATALAKAQNFPPDTKTSYQRDLETPGKKNEGDLFVGTIMRLGQALGVPTPVTQQVFAEIQCNYSVCLKNSPLPLS